MRIFGFEIKRAPVTLSSPDSTRGWWPAIRESYAGAWQQNVVVTLADVLTHPIVFACISLIADDMAKMGIRLVQLDDDGIWTPTERTAFSPFLRQPNHFQNQIQFVQSWMYSKLAYGNTYALKQHDNRGVVTAAYVLDATRVRVLVAEDGSVYYELKIDPLSQLPKDTVTVPASEIMHDRINAFYHPLVGLPPLFSSGLTATMGLKAMTNSANLFANGANPGGILTTPTAITKAKALEIKEAWDSAYTGDNVGKVAVLGDDMKFQQLGMTAVDTQQSEQLDWVSRAICSSFKVPAYMVGVGPDPTYNNIQVLTQNYYDRCLQIHIESFELALDWGLGLAPNKIDGVRLGTEMDTDNLLRMDTASLVSMLKEGTGAGIFSHNEARKRVNYGPVKGGESPMTQQQQFSLAALSDRDQSDPFSKPNDPTPAPVAATPQEAKAFNVVSFEGYLARALASRSPSVPAVAVDREAVVHG